ncbi:cyclodeaminase/cyclohydrolase family protein [Wukongibacter sp. M2B1]|uniref:cyclodeaminase/cyclohydrolase family protein n=1 Tax=Wukongibacter sp. M2B1 TaxID=3088895 RepID=UPI003D7B941E
MFEKNINDFLEDLASSKPTPGGGSASALVGSIGIALGMMVGDLTLNNKKYVEEKEVVEVVKEAMQNAQSIMDEMNDLAIADIEVFEHLSAAYRMPRSTDEERICRDRVLQKALNGAIEVPLKVAQKCNHALDALEILYEKGTKMAVSDIAVGVWCCLAALKGAKFNILINLKLMKDQEQYYKFQKQLYDLEKSIESRCLQMSDRITAELVRDNK